MAADKKEDNLKCQSLLEQQIKLDPSSSKSYFVNANDLVNSILDKRKEIAHHDKNCPFSCIYGVTMSGCVQKRLVVPDISCGYLIFLYHLKQRHLNHYNMSPLQKKHQEILKWMKQCIEKIRKERCTDNIRILHSSKSLLRIKWKGLEYHIAIAWTFSKRQYCKQTMEKIFFKKNMSASLSLLRVYYVREKLVGRNIRLAVLFLKLWQFDAMKDKQHLSNNSLEIICVHLFKQLEKARSSDTPILAFDIVEEFFKLISQYVKCSSKSIFIAWPFRCLLGSGDICEYKQTICPGKFVILDNLILQGGKYLLKKFFFFAFFDVYVNDKKE
ncbi:hypothetical protein RFI_28213 [Reticulomyxa filosa]|uniref:Uncharacterized protein n=1 Tax=Reticulomyxa filosa TaxID=46433 RepID=X6M820_RETFI|nr:hypothetical protein RFI_28213 [Reticulomyxa filosa]|eukprot:ETO09175.1 hypothetical protein RFI_28213 [Reticulomyxa filosa]